MSDQWEFFSCQMGEHLAFIFLDVGIDESISAFPDTHVRLRLDYKQPSENGLPTDNEFEVVSAIEERIDSFAAGTTEGYVGRVTTNGSRYFYAYSQRTPEQVEAFVEEIQSTYDYRLSYFVDDDADKQSYWDDLYPTGLDWRQIWDSRVIDTLRESGDSCEKPRPIDHWALFGRETDAQGFRRWAEAEGFTVVKVFENKSSERGWNVHLQRADTPNLQMIYPITCMLVKGAKDYGGEYDGWEAPVLAAQS